jgi:hypothetical protein
MSKPTNCMNTKCSGLIMESNAPEGEIGTCWYECKQNFKDAKKCPGGVSVKDFKAVECKPEFTIKDSGKRKEFSTGMVRDSEDKIRYDLIYMPMLTRWADHMTKGAQKYSPNNWMKAETPEELSRFMESSFRHFIQWFTNANDGEDHASAVFFNISGAELVKEKLGPEWQTLLKEYQLGKSDNGQ